MTDIPSSWVRECSLLSLLQCCGQLTCRVPTAYAAEWGAGTAVVWFGNVLVLSEYKGGYDFSLVWVTYFRHSAGRSQTHALARRELGARAHGLWPWSHPHVRQFRKRFFTSAVQTCVDAANQKELRHSQPMRPYPFFLLQYRECPLGEWRHPARTKRQIVCTWIFHCLCCMD